MKMVNNLQIEAVASNNKLRSIASQILACTSPNLLLLDLGMAISFATIALPDLLNASEGLSLNEAQASWFGSLSSLTQPLGACLSGPIVDYFGRRKANFLANIPHLVAWIFMYFAWNVPSLFLANALLGIGSGIMEAPINAYVGEITEPSIRGTLCTVTNVFASIGILAMFFLGTVVNWRHAALISLVVPVCSMLMVIFLPETPVWLLTQGREKDALKALCKLRGWTTPDKVQDEYNNLVVYAKDLRLCPICQKTNSQECEHHKMNIVKRSMLKIRYVMLSKETLRPLIFAMMYFMFSVMSGLTPIRPNMVNLCGAFGMGDDGKNIVLMVGIITFLITVVITGLIKVIGKRKLGITAMLGTAISCTGLSIYAKLNIPDSVFSYDVDTFPKEKSYIPLIFLYALTLFTGAHVPWVLLGEIFPFRSRASAQGIAAAWNYVVTFVGAKTYINLENHIRLWGTFAVYGGFAYVGTIYLYFFMPETEGVSLQDIETYYKGKLKMFANDPFINFFKKFFRTGRK